MRKQKVLIAGGGVPGLALALSLSRLDRLDITLIEPKPPGAFDGTTAAHDGRTVAIMQNHVDFLDGLGVWSRVAPFAAPLETMRIIDRSMPGHAPSAPHDFRAAEIGAFAFAWNVPVAALRAAIWDALPSTIRHAQIMPENEDFDLKIAADGRHSPLRDQAGIKARFHDTGQAALTFVVSLPEPHENVSTEIHRPDGPLTFVPLADPKHCAIVFVGREKDQQKLLQDGIKTIEQEFEKYDVKGINIISDPSLLPLPFMTVDALFKDNIILTAEAAHVLHPMGAQGMNLSLTDIRTLTQHIEKTLENGLEISNPLHVAQPYAVARRSDHLLRTGGIMASLGFLRQGAWTGPIRRGVLSALDHLPGVKKALMRVGQGRA